MLVIEARLVCFATPFILLSRSLESSELLVPVRLERVGDEPARRVDLHVALLGKVYFVLRAVDLHSTQPIGFVQALPDLVLHRHAQLERHRLHEIHEPIADRSIDRFPVEKLTGWLAVRHGADVASVGG